MSCNERESLVVVQSLVQVVGPPVHVLNRLGLGFTGGNRGIDLVSFVQQLRKLFSYSLVGEY